MPPNSLRRCFIFETTVPLNSLRRCYTFETTPRSHSSRIAYAAAALSSTRSPTDDRIRKIQPPSSLRRRVEELLVGVLRQVYLQRSSFAISETPTPRIAYAAAFLRRPLQS